MRGGVYCARNVAVEMVCERCEEERDFAVSGNGVYGGGGPRAVAVGLRGPTMGGLEGVKRKGRFGKDAVVSEDARLRVSVLLLPDEHVRLLSVRRVALEFGTIGKEGEVPPRG
jgi:hypothetical protein